MTDEERLRAQDEGLTPVSGAVMPVEVPDEPDHEGTMRDDPLDDDEAAIVAGLEDDSEP